MEDGAGAVPTVFLEGQGRGLVRKGVSTHAHEPIKPNKADCFVLVATTVFLSLSGPGNATNPVSVFIRLRKTYPAFRNSAGFRMAMFRYGFRMCKSGSLDTMISAPTDNASSRNLLSFGSRQSKTTSLASCHADFSR